MKLKDIINKLDKSLMNEEYVSISDLAEELDIFDVWGGVTQDKLKCYWIAAHLCTDTWVGWRAYFLEDILAAVSYQPARKSDETFHWVSEYAYISVRDYILSLRDEEDGGLDIDILDPNLDIGDHYPIEYAGQFLKSEVLYKGKVAKIKNQKQYEFKEPSVEIDVDGDIFWVYPSDLETPFNILTEK